MRIYLMSSIGKFGVLNRIMPRECFINDTRFCSRFKTLNFRMTEYDRKLFICDPRVVNWKQYYIYYGLGARQHLLRDSFDNYKQGIRVSIQHEGCTSMQF